MFGLLAIPAMAFATGCSSSSSEPLAEGSVTEARQALTQCVTIQRGVYGTFNDALLSATQMNANDGASATTSVNNKAELLLQADLSFIPSYAVVNSATLKLYMNAGAGSGQGNANGVFQRALDALLALPCHSPPSHRIN